MIANQHHPAFPASGHNPFSTRFTQPGSIPFLLNPDQSLANIAGQFRNHRYLGQIVGHHGSGKTTLTHALESHLSNDFATVRRITIRGRRNILARQIKHELHSNVSGCLLVVDGLERLPWIHQRLLLQQVGYPKIGLLVTTHRAHVGVPVLFETRPTLETLRKLTNQLAPGLAMDDQVLASALQQNPGNIRESLMTLYDWYETLESPATNQLPVDGS